MCIEVNFEAARDMSPAEPGEQLWPVPADSDQGHVRVRTYVVRRREARPHLPPPPCGRHLGVDPRTVLLSIPGALISGSESSGQSLDFQHLKPVTLRRPTESLRRRDVQHRKKNDPFHDSETDLFDLFNACDGVVLENGLLDVSQLDQFTPDEAEALNVPRLREIWKHTESGCAQCAAIISTLNRIRGALREDAAELSAEQVEDVSVEINDSIS
jgi:hypothetical protein